MDVSVDTAHKTDWKKKKKKKKARYLHASLMNRRTASKIPFQVDGQAIALMARMFLYLFGKLKIKGLKGRGGLKIL